MIFNITAYLLTVVVLGIYTFYSLRRDGWRRYVGPIGFAGVTFLYLFSISLSLGSCIPQWAAWNTRMDVVSILYDEPRNIYLWGVQAGSPKCVILPWSDEAAKKIRGQENEAMEGGQMLEYLAPKGLESEGVLHPKPQEALPLKDEQ